MGLQNANTDALSKQASPSWHCSAPLHIGLRHFKLHVTSLTDYPHLSSTMAHHFKNYLISDPIIASLVGCACWPHHWSYNKHKTRFLLQHIHLHWLQSLSSWLQMSPSTHWTYLHFSECNFCLVNFSFHSRNGMIYLEHWTMDNGQFIRTWTMNNFTLS